MRAGRGFSRRARRARHTFAPCATTALVSADDGRLSLPSGGNAGLSVAGHCDYFVQLPSMVEARTEPADRHGLPVRHSFNAVCAWKDVLHQTGTSRAPLPGGRELGGSACR
jgi:hypothetical protein